MNSTMSSVKQLSLERRVSVELHWALKMSFLTNPWILGFLHLPVLDSQEKGKSDIIDMT